LCVALLTLAAGAPIFRSSNPPGWTRRGWVGELVMLAIVSTLALGLGYLGAGAIDVFRRGHDYIELGLLVMLLLVSTTIWRRLEVRARPTVFGAEGSVGAHA
jgi:hypothetical protein